jgi:hypothetical protein
MGTHTRRQRPSANRVVIGTERHLGARRVLRQPSIEPTPIGALVRMDPWEIGQGRTAADALDERTRSIGLEL